MREPLGPVHAGSDSSAKKRSYKCVYTIDVPTMESTSAATGTGIAPAPTVAYVHSSRTEFMLPERGTLANRNDLLAYCVNGLLHGTIRGAIQNLEGFF